MDIATPLTGILSSSPLWLSSVVKARLVPRTLRVIPQPEYRRWRLFQTAVVKVPTVPMLVKRTLSPRTPIRGDDLTGRRDGASLNGVCGWCCRHSVPEPSPCHDVNTAGVVDSSFPEKRPCGAWRHTPVARLPPRTKECQDMLKPSCTGSGGALRNEHVTSIIIDSCGKAFERVAPRTVGCTEVLRANGTLERARRPSRSRLTDDPRVPGSSGASADERSTGLAVSERLRRRRREPRRCGCVARLARVHVSECRRC